MDVITLSDFDPRTARALQQAMQGQDDSLVELHTYFPRITPPVAPLPLEEVEL